MPERKYEIPAGDEIDYAADTAKWLESGPTATQELFGTWVAEKTGAADRFKTQKEVTAFQEGVQLALKYRMHFQRSAENHEGKDAARAAREQEAAAKPKRAPKTTAEDEAPARPARRGRPAKVAAEEAPAKPVRRGRVAAAAKGATAEAPVKPARRPAATGAKRPAARRGAAAAEADF